MHLSTRRALPVAMLVALLALVHAADALSGKWSGTANSPQGAVSFKLALTLAESAVTGTISSDMGSDAISGGTFDGETLSFTTTYNGMPVSMSAKLTNDKLVGAFSVNGGEAAGDWEATRDTP